VSLPVVWQLRPSFVVCDCVVRHCLCFRSPIIVGHYLLQKSESLCVGVLDDTFVFEDSGVARRIFGPVETAVEDTREALEGPAQVVACHADAHIADYGLVVDLGTAALHAPLRVDHYVAHSKHYFVFIALDF
jgi:hypothetical protein